MYPLRGCTTKFRIVYVTLNSLECARLGFLTNTSLPIDRGSFSSAPASILFTEDIELILLESSAEQVDLLLSTEKS